MMATSCFHGENILVLDLETARSAEEVEGGWENHAGLGLAIGAFYDYQDGQVHWFDVACLPETILDLVTRRPLIVSFNGIRFDLPLMLTVLSLHPRWPALQDVWEHTWRHVFREIAAASYDILAEVWRAAGQSLTRGINSLDALCQANALGQKTGSGVLAPKLWQAGRVAQVLNYCQHDIMLTKALFERIQSTGGQLQRRDDVLMLRTVRKGADGWCVA